MKTNPEMALGMTERLKPIHEKVARMVREEIIPLDEEFLAEVGKGGGRFHSSAAWFRTRYNSFMAASSLGKWPLVRTARRSFEFNASIWLVV
ncbi:hypothetical protein ATER59S_05513 [Aquamicrobium terrae]